MSAVAFLESVTSVAQLHELRSVASRWLSDAGADEETTERVALVLSEACTNALTHGQTDVVDVEITVEHVGDATLVTVRTCHHDHDPNALAAPITMPGPAAVHGRGLALVERLVDGMTLLIDPPQVVRRCWLRTGGTSSGR